MKETENKHIDTLASKVMKRSALESPSLNFTANLMTQVNATKQNSSTVYQPIISNRGWLLVAMGLGVFVTYILYFGQSQSNGWLNRFNLSGLTPKINHLFSGMQPSKIALYGILFLAIMIMIQVPVLKHYFDKRLNY